MKMEQTMTLLRNEGYQVNTNQQDQPNDAGIRYGQ
jgi:hypothetical protein